MTPVEVPCSHCGRYLQVPDDPGAAEVVCPACGGATAAVAAAPSPPADPAHFPELRRDCEPHRGTLVLMLGIVSLVSMAIFPPLGVPFGLVAWVMGQKDIRKIRRKEMDPEGEAATNAGRLCGMVGTILALLMTVFLVVVYSILIGLIIMSPGGTTRPVPPPPPSSGPPPRPMPPPPPVSDN